ncbi:MAG: Mur ligase domain-containing protein, partial [Chloroflexota bacterium]
MIDELEAFRHVHFVGIAGIGMSALARLLVARRIEISGSDIDPGEQGESLAELGITVVAGHAAGNIRGADLVVVSSAVTESNPEIEAAREQGIRIVKRAELLAVIMNAGFGIAVAGTHGKTTTSALIAHVLIEAGRDPTVLIGGMSAGLASNARVGGDVTVVEADEYDGSFLLLRPAIAVLTNIEPDNLDFYKTIDRLHDAFRTFVAGVRDVLVVCADDAVALDLGRQSPATLFTYGLLEGDWQ